MLPAQKRSPPRQRSEKPDFPALLALSAFPDGIGKRWESGGQFCYPGPCPDVSAPRISVPPPDPVTESVGARLRGFLFESDPVWRWWRRRAG